jgi:fibronectin type 3 domain-containing protein
VQDLKFARKGQTVSLTWSAPSLTTDGTLIKKSGKMTLRRVTDEAHQVVVREIPLDPALAKQSRAQSVQESLADLPATSADFAIYTVQAENHLGKTAGASNQVAVPLVPTLIPPADVQAVAVPQGINISWSQADPPQNPTRLSVRYAYRLQRRQEGSAQFSVIKQLPAGRGRASFTDTAIEWEKTYQYWITPLTVWQQNEGNKGEVEGEDSAPATVLAHDIFPPEVPSGLQAVFSGDQENRFVDLIWAANADLNLAGYNVYRRTGDEAPVKINSELTKTPAYRDSAVQPGTKYFYSVSAVDVRNNESKRSTEAAETVPR